MLWKSLSCIDELLDSSPSSYHLPEPKDPDTALSGYYEPAPFAVAGQTTFHRACATFRGLFAAPAATTLSYYVVEIGPHEYDDIMLEDQWVVGMKYCVSLLSHFARAFFFGWS